MSQPNSTQQNAYNGALATGIGVIQDQLGNICVVGAKMTAGAAANNVLVSDASGNLANQALPAASMPAATTTTRGAVILDGTAGDIAAVGVAAAAGSTGKAADAGHVHTGLSRVATTGTTGYALVNGTGTIISWAVPNDGNLHSVMLIASLHVTVNETGGQLAVSWTLPDNTSFLSNLFSAGMAAGVAPTVFTAAIRAGTTFALTQNTALTGGTATAWAEIWGS